MSFSVEINRFLNDPHRAFQAGLRKGRKEVSVKNLTKDEREQIDAGKAKEISQWLKYKVIRAVPRSEAKGRVLLQMRWVLTFKSDGTGKGRIVVRGYQHESLGGFRTESPTASRRCKHLFYLKCAQEKWLCEEGDVRAAFLQGDLQAKGDEHRIFAEPVITRTGCRHGASRRPLCGIVAVRKRSCGRTTGMARTCEARSAGSWLEGQLH